MPVEWTVSIVVPISKWKGDNRNCSCQIAVKLLEHGMKVVEWVLEKKRLGNLLTADEIQYSFV